MFRPLVAWVARFRVEQEPGAHEPRSWALTMMRRSRLIQAAKLAFHATVLWTSRAVRREDPRPREAAPVRRGRGQDRIWVGVVAALVMLGVWRIATDLVAHTDLAEFVHVVGLAVLTMIRVFVLIVLASVVWVPIGVWVGLRPRAAEIVQPIAQFMAAFPANLLFPVAIYAIVVWRLRPDIWLSPLMILGTQWYILFNVIAGAAALPTELRQVSANLGVKGWLWWRKVALPGVLPYYVTGAITASGGSWNAAQVAEFVNWGHTRIEARGLGSYIAAATAAGRFNGIVLGVAVMSLFVVALNRLFWRPLYYYAERRFRLS
jgi:NitT/TauT family transport system permease protein